MKRSWLLVFACMAWFGARPGLASAQENSCPLTGNEPFHQREVPASDCLPMDEDLLNPSAVGHEQDLQLVSTSSGSGSNAVGYWDGYQDYLHGFYPYDYYDDTAELKQSRSHEPSDSLWTNVDADDSVPLPHAYEESPLYEAMAYPGDEHSPFYATFPYDDEANYDGYAAQQQAVAGAYARLDASTEGDFESHDDVALSQSVASTRAPSSSTPQPQEPEPTTGPVRDYADYDYGYDPYEGDDGYWENGYWDDIEYGPAPSSTSNSDNKDELAELASRSDDEEQFDGHDPYEYGYDDYEYWYGDDNNAPPVAQVETSEPESQELATAPERTEDYDFEEANYGYDGYDYEQYGPEYGYEFDYSEQPSAEPQAWNSGVDDLYARQSDIDGDTQAPTWFDEEDWNSEPPAVTPIAPSTPAPSKSSTAPAAKPESVVPSQSDTVSADTLTEALGEGDFYAVQRPSNESLPSDYESQFDGTSNDTYWNDYEEAWFEHNNSDFESDYDASNDIVDWAPESKGVEQDYWQEYSNYVEPAPERRAIAMDHGQSWFGEPNSNTGEFEPPHAPLPDSYWPEEYQPYDIEVRSATVVPYRLPYARAVAPPMNWLMRSMTAQSWRRVSRVTVDYVQQQLDQASDWIDAQVLPPLEVCPTATEITEPSSEDWDCDRAWETGGRVEVVSDTDAD